MKGQEVVFSHKSDEWSTPQVLFDELNAEFNFGFDLAASHANKKCSRYTGDLFASGILSHIEYSEEYGFCNPPYSDIKSFVRAFSIYDVNVVCLLPARTDTKWFHDYCYNKPNVEIRFIKGRLKFGDSKNNAPFPSMIVIFRKTDENL